MMEKKPKFDLFQEKLTEYQNSLKNHPLDEARAKIFRFLMLL